jgi:alanyl-tRNA synthetase
VLAGKGFRVRVTDTRRVDGVFVHFGRLEEGSRGALHEGVAVQAEVDRERRLAIQRNHTATHLAHAALRSVLGNHVQQKGSLVAPDRLRFDLSHYDRISDEEIRRIEDDVVKWILADRELVVGEYDRGEALERGALAFFGEKYGERVRVVEIPAISMELCGGAHVKRTGEIGGFQIVSEGSVSSGVRRIEAVTAQGALERSQGSDSILRDLGTLLKAGRDEIVARVQRLVAENRELRSPKGKAGKGQAETPDLVRELDGGAGDREQVDGWEIVWGRWEGVPMEELLRASDALKRRAGKRVFILAAFDESGVRFTVGTSQEAPGGVVHCGRIANQGAQVMGGGGGGRPDLAQAGGKDVSKLDEAVAGMREAVVRSIQAGRA